MLFKSIESRLSHCEKPKTIVNKGRKGSTGAQIVFLCKMVWVLNIDWGVALSTSLRLTFICWHSFDNSCQKIYDSPETVAWWVGGPVIGDILLNVSACCISVFPCLTMKNKLVKCREFFKTCDFFRTWLFAIFHLFRD